MEEKHDDPSVCPGVCSMRIVAPSPKGSVSPSRTRARCSRAIRSRARRARASRSSRWERPRNVGGRVAVIGVLVRDEDVLQMVVAVAQDAQQILRDAGRIDERGASSASRERRRNRCSGCGSCGWRRTSGVRSSGGMPALRGAIGEFAGVEVQNACARARASCVVCASRRP